MRSVGSSVVRIVYIREIHSWPLFETHLFQEPATPGRKSESLAEPYMRHPSSVLPLADEHQ